MGRVVDSAAWVLVLIALNFLVVGHAAAADGDTPRWLRLMGEDGLRAEVAKLSQELSDLEEQVNRWDWNVAETRGELAARQEDMVEITAELASRRDYLSRVLRAISSYSREGLFQALLDPSNVELLDLRLRYLRCLLSWQAGQVELFRLRAKAFGEMVREVRDMEARIEALQQKLLAQKDDVLRKKLAAELAMLEDRQAEETIALSPSPVVDGEADALPSRDRRLRFAERKGYLSWPVDATGIWYYNQDATREMGSAAGESHSGGIEVKAVEGEEIFPVAEGRVLFAGPLRGYGRLVIVDHGENYYSLYGYMNEMSVEVGEEVGLGSVLGTVGRGGVRREPMLYFEVRHYGQPEDPLAWLQDNDAAGDSAPVAAPAHGGR